MEHIMFSYGQVYIEDIPLLAPLDEDEGFSQIDGSKVLNVDSTYQSTLLIERFTTFFK